MNIIELAEQAGMTRRQARQSRAPYWDVVIDSELEHFAALVLEEAAKVCDVTPPQPFRPSIEAAHAIRALKGEKK